LRFSEITFSDDVSFEEALPPFFFDLPPPDDDAAGFVGFGRAAMAPAS